MDLRYSMIAPTSSASKTNSGMSGWPVEMPSASASPSPSTLNLRESVRKGGACGWGLTPLRPTAWQRAQLAISNSSPGPAGVPAFSSRVGGVSPILCNANISQRRPPARMTGPACSSASRVGDYVEQPIAQQGFFHNRHAGFFGFFAQRRAGLAGNQNRRRRKVPIAQIGDQLQPAGFGAVFVDDQAIATA